MGAIDHTLAAPADFLQQLIVPEVAQHSCRSRGLLPIRCPHAVVTAGVNDPGYRFSRERTKAGF
jgi:hypothetical protein